MSLMDTAHSVYVGYLRDFNEQLPDIRMSTETLKALAKEAGMAEPKPPYVGATVLGAQIVIHDGLPAGIMFSPTPDERLSELLTTKAVPALAESSNQVEPESAFVVHIEGPDDVLPFSTWADATRCANDMNLEIATLGNRPFSPHMWAIPYRRSTFDAIQQSIMPYPPHGTCDRPPRGWWCSLDNGHDGPCPARPS